MPVTMEVGSGSPIGGPNPLLDRDLDSRSQSIWGRGSQSAVSTPPSWSPASSVGAWVHAISIVGSGSSIDGPDPFLFFSL
ncbi:hypothetical protein CRG98_005449 [Punica granatum]|uniref:Uncharacterized protein n=1 Tax=Punica granatum TaxID=22663 RepID=A0A2I0L0G3_PUNGR|nr:hypothetical protein CRG98_005449 [Punica granatum]